jgi:hypothetical protein
LAEPGHGKVEGFCEDDNELGDRVFYAFKKDPSFHGIGCALKYQYYSRNQYFRVSYDL